MMNDFPIEKKVKAEEELEEVPEDTLFDKRARKQWKNPFMQLTVKQRMFIKRYFECGNAGEAWCKAFAYKDKVRGSIMASNFFRNHPEVKEWIYTQLGLDTFTVVKVLKDAFEAKKFEYADKQVFERVDHYARLTAVKLANKMLNLENVDGGKVGNQLNVQIVSDGKTIRVTDGTVEGETMD